MSVSKKRGRGYFQVLNLIFNTEGIISPNPVTSITKYLSSAIMTHWNFRRSITIIVLSAFGDLSDLQLIYRDSQPSIKTLVPSAYPERLP